MQVHGGIGYSRRKAFEHIYRHHRRYRITEGAEEIQIRRVAGDMFGFMGQQAPKGVHEVGSGLPKQYSLVPLVTVVFVTVTRLSIRSTRA